MSDILAFIEARLGDEEATARAASPGQWAWTSDDELASDEDNPTDGDRYVLASMYGGGIDATAEDRAHIVGQQPKVTLARVAALRALVTMHAESGVVVGVCRHDTKPSPCPSLRHVAAIWAPHPDFDESWRP